MHPQTNLAWLKAECAKQTSLEALAEIALAELRKFPNGCSLVCGPITTGGRGSVAENFRVFNAVIKALLELGLPIFSQMPYEDSIFRLREEWLANPENAGKYFFPVLEKLYLPIIQSGCVKKGIFIPGWQSSDGARWEKDQLGRVGASIGYLTEDWVNRLLVAA